MNGGLYYIVCMIKCGSNSHSYVKNVQKLIIRNVSIAIRYMSIAVTGS